MAAGFPGKGDPKAWVRATKYFNDGIDYAAKKKYKEAIRQYNQAISIYKFSPTFYANLGYALERDSNPAAGVEACKKATEVDKTFPGGWENLGNCQYDLGKYSDSRDSFNEALKCDLKPSKRNELLDVVQKLTEIIDKGGK